MNKKAFIKYLFLALLSLVVLYGLFIYSYPQKFTSKEIAKPQVTHYSASSLNSFIDNAYAEATPQKTDNDAIGGILVNHHLFGAHFIAESFGKIATQEPVTVLLVSPNHFSTGSDSIISSRATWQTPYGKVSPDLDTIDNLKNNNIVSVEEEPFEQEHGISGIVSFIKRSLPNAKIVPLIVKDNLPVTRALELASSINVALPTNTLIVGSFDFSHYLTHRAADFHDISSLNVVQNFEYEKISRLDIDSHPGLAIFLKLLELNQAQSFHLQTQSNSALLAKTDGILETTSYITGYFTKGQVNNSSSTNTLLAFGSIDANAKTVSSLNRHSPSFSIKFLERLFFGQDTTTAFIEPNQTLEQQLAKLKINSVIKDNKVLNLGTLKIAYINPKANKHPLALAKNYIENGADMVIINGPLGKIETYKNKLIFSGLGEFLTEQTLSSKTPTHSLAIGLATVENKLNIYLLPIKIEQGIAQLLTSPTDVIVLEELSNKSELNLDIKQQILSGVITINFNNHGTK